MEYIVCRQEIMHAKNKALRFRFLEGLNRSILIYRHDVNLLYPRHLISEVNNPNYCLGSHEDETSEEQSGKGFAELKFIA